jgi:tetratricopeptide (TPR) repeat protein
MTSYDPAAEDQRLREAVRLREARDREGLVALAERHPHDAAVAYQCAWLHDTLGHEADAAPFYETALAGPNLTDEERLGAHTGLGSTYRVLGRYEDALAAFDRALLEYPADPALTAFRAIALHNLGRADEAVSSLLKLLTHTSSAPGIAAYRRAIEYYADHLDETVG